LLRCVPHPLQPCSATLEHSPPPACPPPHRSGLGGVEMFAMGLKATGAYLCRTLSYRDAEFRLEVLDIEPAFK